MWKLYGRFVTVHKAIVHIYGFQEQCAKIAQSLKDIHIFITHVQEWTMRYKGASLSLQNIMKPRAKLEKAWIQMLIRNYEKLPLPITRIEASYACFFKIPDVIVRTHRFPSIITLTQAMKKNQFLLEVNNYIEQLMWEATINDLQWSAENMQKYIGGPNTLKTMLGMLQDELDRGSWTIYPESMEVIVCFEKDITKQYGGTIAQYQAWYQFITEAHKADVVDLVFPQDSEGWCLSC